MNPSIENLIKGIESSSQAQIDKSCGMIIVHFNCNATQKIKVFRATLSDEKGASVTLYKEPSFIDSSTLRDLTSLDAYYYFKRKTAFEQGAEFKIEVAENGQHCIYHFKHDLSQWTLVQKGVGRPVM